MQLFAIVSSALLILPVLAAPFDFSAPSDTTTLLKPGTIQQHIASAAAGTRTWLSYCQNMNFGGNCAEQYPNLGVCYNVARILNNAITSYSVVNGCCAFYDGEGCTNKLFVAFNRKDTNINAQNNDRISTYRCNSDCNGL
ncbi:hypothetical protein BDD12DRAFT_812429 [Trichophaea hybrida]|nr:hypothetical protein BDD12DRAFT_812429 [Trichophaea hybrida]